MADRPLGDGARRARGRSWPAGRRRSRAPSSTWCPTSPGSWPSPGSSGAACVGTCSTTARGAPPTACCWHRPRGSPTIRAPSTAPASSSTPLLGAVSCVLLALLAARLTGRSRPTCAGARRGGLPRAGPAVHDRLGVVGGAGAGDPPAVPARRRALRRRRPPALGDRDGRRRGARLRDPQPAAAAGDHRWAARPRRGRGAVTSRSATPSGCSPCSAILLLGVARFSSWIVERVWETPASPTPPAASSVASPTPAPLATSAIGQLWYQLVATLGLAGIGVIALVRSASRRAADDRPRRADRGRRPDAAGDDRAAARACRSSS